MYCSQCGKKVMETMLFCPFCGSPIVIPDQEIMETAVEPMDGLPVNGNENTSAQKRAGAASNLDKPLSNQASSDPTMPSQALSDRIHPETALPETEQLDIKGSDSSISKTGKAYGQKPEVEDDLALWTPPDWENSQAISEEPERDISENSSSGCEDRDYHPRSLFDRNLEGNRDAHHALAHDDRTEALHGRRDIENVEEEFRPLNLSAEVQTASKLRVNSDRSKSDESDPHPSEPLNQGEPPIRLNGRAPRLEGKTLKTHPSSVASNGSTKRAASTLVPSKSFDPEDMFMDDEDDYDAFDDIDVAEDLDEDYEFEDPESGSFFVRHIRGIVGFSLFGILVLVFLFYAFSDLGQMGLARINLAWSAESYSRLGYESYQSAQYEQAGSYYEKALARDSDNFDYASSAAMAYITGQNAEKATMMLKECIQIRPNSLEAYLSLLSLYPDSATRPWDVTQLLQQGYQMTGDDRLKNVAG